MAELNLNTTTNTLESGSGGIKIAGTDVATVDNGVLLPDGTKSAPAVRFTDDSNTGIYSPSNDVTNIVGHGEDIVSFVGVSNSVNYLEIQPSATGNRVSISSVGSDANVGLDLNAKGTGSIHTSSEEFRIQVGAAGQAFVNGYTILVDEDNISRLTNDSGFITDYTVTEGDVTAHQAALSITESQISDLGSYLTDITGQSINSLSNVHTSMSPTDGQVLTYDTTNGWQAETPSAGGGGISNVVEDTTPQLGGDLDVNGNDIVSLSNATINILPNGTGDVKLGNFLFDVDQTVSASEDDYVLTYDNATGKISLEEAAAGGGSVSELNDLSDVSIGSSIGAQRYWRVLYISNDDGTSCRLAEIEWKDTASGSDLATTQTNAISSSTSSAFWDDQYVYADDGTSRNWLNNGSEPVSSAYIGYDFGAGNEKSIVEMTIQSSTAPTQSPSAFFVQYSSDNVSWSTAASFTGQTWTSGEIKTFTIPTASGALTGDMLAFDGTYWTPISKGSDTQILSANSSESTGLQWINQPGATNWVHANNGNDFGTAPSGTGSNSFSIGNNAYTATRADCIALGTNAYADDGNNSTAVGSYAQANSGGFSAGNGSGTGSYTASSAVGTSATFTGNYAASFGYRVTCGPNEAVVGQKAFGAVKANAIRIQNEGQASLDGLHARFNFPEYTVATVPTVGVETGDTIYLSDGDAGSACLATYDGTNWKVVAFGATISAT